MAITREQILQYTGGSNKGADILAAAQRYGFTPEDVDRAFGRTAGTSQAWLQQNMPTAPVPQVAPQTAQVSPNSGLAGAESAITHGAQLGLDQINKTLQQTNELFQQGQAQLQPFTQTGQQAFDLQAALSGALGGDAQATAMQNFQSSPGQQYLLEQGEKALLRNASAIGGLGGGAVRNELQRHAIGAAAQDFDAQFGRLGQVGQTGFNSAALSSGLSGQQAGLTANLGQSAANIPVNAGMQTGGFRYQAGRDLANSISGSTSALASLMDQQGRGVTDILSNNTSNLANLLQGVYAGDAQSKEQLGAILSNLGVQGSSQYSSQPIIPGMGGNMLNQLGQVANGMGGFMYGLNQMQNPATGPASGYNTMPGYGPSYVGGYNPLSGVA